MLAWQTGFREVVNLLRPQTPLAEAIQACGELGQGVFSNEDFVFQLAEKHQSWHAARVLPSSM